MDFCFGTLEDTDPCSFARAFLSEDSSFSVSFLTNSANCSTFESVFSECVWFGTDEVDASVGTDTSLLGEGLFRMVLPNPDFSFGERG